MPTGIYFRTDKHKENISLARLGKTSWNKGVPMSKEHKKKLSDVKKGKHYSLFTEFKRGQSGSPATQFKKGQSTWNKGLKGYMEGALSSSWKGDDVGYGALHKWIYRKLGQPDTCEHCAESELKNNKIHWANKSGEYKRQLTDWLRLCVSCHSKYDKENGLGKAVEKYPELKNRYIHI